MVNNEYKHLNSEMNYQRNSLEKQMSEHQIVVNKMKLNKSTLSQNADNSK